MKLTVYLNFISFYFYLSEAGIYNNGTRYIPLIKSIRSYYSTSAIYFLHSNNHDKNFDESKITYLSFLWSKMFQREQIATVSSNFKNIYELIKHSDNLRPLIIVFIPGLGTIYEFSNCTKSLNMSLFAWLVIFMSTPMNSEYKYCRAPPTNLFNLLFDTEMLVICYDDPILREWYSVDGVNTEIFDLMKWHSDRESSESPTTVIELLTNLSLYERRKDLRGKVLRAVTVKNSILFTYKDNKLTGYLSPVIKDLQNALNFTLDIVAEVHEYGSFNMTSKRWDGAFSLVASREIDIGLSGFSMTNIRLDYIDYSVPILANRNCLYLKQPQTFVVKWFAYYETFSFGLWMSLLMIIIIASFVLSYIKSRIESCGTMQIMFNEFINVWGIFCQQGTAEIPRNSSLRLAYFTMLVTAMVISAAYSASLICFVTARSYHVPFRTVDEFIKDGTYDVIVIKSSSDYDMFAYSNDSVSKDILKLLRPVSTLPLDIKEGFESVCRNFKLAFFSSYMLHVQEEALGFSVPCKVYCINFGRVDTSSLIFSKNSQYTSIFNYYLQKFVNTDLLDQLMSEINFKEESKFEPVGFFSIVSVLVIFICGVALALVILIVEIYCNSYND